ncbi:MAG: mechanosensitive ion channel family protein, partial [Solirubrobacterales bacterium]|nr:mechanosensitive ion channel family protein [Solirubrobacterales bacterium]
AGLQVQVNEQVVTAARRRLLLTIPLLIAAIVARQLALDHIDHLHRHTRLHPYGHGWIVGKTPVQVVAVLLVLVLGWLISRDVSRIVPSLFRRMDPATAGTVEFITRFLAVAATVLGALAVADVALPALAVGGGFTAVVLGLAAQQTLGNLFAGMVLLSAQPFRLGERIRLQAGATGGKLDGVVSSLGLLYTTLSRGKNQIMIPNNVVINSVVMPLREPAPLDVRVRLNAGVRPSHVEALLQAQLGEAGRSVDVLLEELDGDHAVISVQATPEDSSDSARLADSIITALSAVTGEHPVGGGRERPSASERAARREGAQTTDRVRRPSGA